MEAVAGVESEKFREGQCECKETVKPRSEPLDSNVSGLNNAKITFSSGNIEGVVIRCRQHGTNVQKPDIKKSAVDLGDIMSGQPGLQER